MTAEPNLDDYSDSELVRRLRQRGYGGLAAVTYLTQARGGDPEALKVCLRAVGGSGG